MFELISSYFYIVERIIWLRRYAHLFISALLLIIRQLFNFETVGKILSWKYRDFFYIPLL